MYQKNPGQGVFFSDFWPAFEKSRILCKHVFLCSFWCFWGFGKKTRLPKFQDVLETRGKFQLQIAPNPVKHQLPSLKPTASSPTQKRQKVLKTYLETLRMIPINLKPLKKNAQNGKLFTTNCTNPLKFAAKWLWGVILTFRFSRLKWGITKGLFVQHRLYRRRGPTFPGIGDLTMVINHRS